MNLQVFKQENEQIQALCAHLHKLIDEILSDKERVTIALSGGTSPINLFKHLSNLDLPWDMINLTLVDERMVNELNHPDSNQTLVCKYLLQNKAIAAKFIPIDPTQKINIDIAILGMGTDGHSASIFPDCDELNQALTTQEQYLYTNPKSAKYQRLSLSLNGITEIPNLFLSISGEIKLKIFKEAMRETNLNYPISYIINQRPDLQVFWHE